jgi:IgA peptidase M64
MAERYAPRMRRSLGWTLLAALLATPPATAGDDPFSSAPDPNAKDESTPEYVKALDLQRRGKWKEAQKAFRDVLAKYPQSVHAEDCETRGGDNCYLGCVKLLESGPPSRRIDVAIMGDGFTIDPKDQKTEEEWAKQYIDALFCEPAYSEYRNCFNFYFVRLASKDTGVDQVLTDAQLKELEEKNKKKAKKKHPKEFNTALDCKEAGPQKQVLADRDLVYQWLAHANKDVPGCGDDGLVIAFARFGKLGMGGGGVANVGPPQDSVDVHEFGHAFVGLLDEYVNNPTPPTYRVFAPNATSDEKEIPWQHFLDKKVKDVGVFEGGATFQKGVWRPSRSCAMNSGGCAGYCPVCREACVLRIYSYVNPIDTCSPDPRTEIRCVEGDDGKITIVPMQPKSHDLEVQWYVDRIPDSEKRPERTGDGSTSDGPNVPPGAVGFGGSTGGDRAYGREPAAYEFPPLGQVSAIGTLERRTKTAPTRFVFPVAKLGRGRWQVTAVVRDPASWPDIPCQPAVLKDPQHLLEERETWWVTVAPRN